MNYKIIVVVIAVIVMLLSPSAIGIMSEGQAFDNKNEGASDKKSYCDVTVDLYVTSTGEKKSMSIEQYVVGVMLAEVPYTYDFEALKAMAVAIRSYCLRRINRGEIILEHMSAQVCDDYTHCMGYISLTDASERWGGERADVFYKTVEEAVFETRGEILTFEGEIADAVFHASSYGHTESAANVWGVNVPYLVCVDTPESATKEKMVYSTNEFCSLIEKEVGAVVLSDDPSEWVGKVEKNNNGRVLFVNIGNKRISGRRMREIFGLSSTCFDIGWVDGNYIFETAGSGHGVGLSMAGCDYFAKSGMDYRQILNHYYTGCQIEVCQTT